MGEAAQHIGVSVTTIRKLTAAGIVSMAQVAPFAPWEIKRSDLDSERVREIVKRMKRTGRLKLGDNSGQQHELFQ